MNAAGASCPTCAADLSATAKFCAECGTPVATVEEAETRRTVTLVFTDVTGSTAMGEALDPEALRTVMGRYFELARTAVERHGGAVEKFVGDAVLAVFGVPTVREDDALRGVRAAFELNAAVAELAVELEAELGVRLAIRTGVNTGSVVTGAARAGGSFATGDAVNTAARLEQHAEPGEVLLGPDTYLLVRDAVEVGPVRLVEAKGKTEPVRARPLLTVDAAAAGRTRRLDTPMVGRDLEVRTLEDTLSRTVESGRGHLVTIVAGAGLGKTRLVADFVDSVGARAAVLQGRCVSYGAGLTYWPLAQALAQGLGLSGSESPEVVRHAVATALAGAPEADEVVAAVLPLLDATAPSVGSELTFWGVCRVLEHLAAQRPIVVAIDDVHWAEPSLLDLLEQVREETRDLPLFLLCQARPELLEAHPGWGQGSVNSVTLSLEPFDLTLTRAVLAGHLDGDVPVELTAVVAAWSGGNPLFVEEIVAHLTETGLLVRGADGWAVTGDLDHAGAPPSVSALLSSRLDRLPAPERRLVERLSIVGLEVTAVEARALADPADLADLPALLASLSRRDFLRRTRTATGEVWSFRHLLVRDAAYDSMSKARRALLHASFADHLEGTDDGGAAQAAFVAHHREQAAVLARELAPHAETTHDLVRHAVTALVEASQQARDQDDVPAIRDLLDRAVALRSPDDTQHRDVLARLHLHHYRGFDVAASHRALAAYVDTLAEPVAALDAAYARCLQLMHPSDVGQPIDVDEARAAAVELLRLAQAEDDDVRSVTALTAMTSLSALSARWAEMHGAITQVAELGDAYDRRAADSWKGAILFLGPAPLSEVAEHVRLARLTARSATSKARVGLQGALVAAAIGDVDAAARLTAWFDDPHAEVDAPRVWAAQALHFLGDPSAVEQMRQAVEHMVEHDDLGHASTYHAWQALWLLEEGVDVEIVAPMVEQAAAWTAETDVLSLALAATGRSLVASLRGDHDLASRLAEQAIVTVDRTDQVNEQADVRRWLSANAHRRNDVPAERALLEEARALYLAKGIVVSVRKVDARLAELDGDAP